MSMADSADNRPRGKRDHFFPTPTPMTCTKTRGRLQAVDSLLGEETSLPGCSVENLVTRNRDGNKGKTEDFT